MDSLGLAASISVSFAASFIFAYILYWFDLYEKEPGLLLGAVFIWGAVVAAGGAFLINSILGLSVFVLTGSEAATNLTTSALIAPIIEEILKGFAVFLVFLVFTHEFDSILDGIVYAGVTALGFAATENAYYIYTFGFLEDGWQGFRQLVFIRLVLVGWQHPFYTAFVGIGFAISRLNRNAMIKLIAPVIDLITAIATHAIHNILASFITGPSGLVFTTFLDWTGWLLMLGFILIVMQIEKQNIKIYLLPEVDLGTLTHPQYEVAISSLKVARKKMQAFFQGRYKKVNRFYRHAAELGLKKFHRERLGEENGNGGAVTALRDQVKSLSDAL